MNRFNVTVSMSDKTLPVIVITPDDTKLKEIDDQIRNIHEMLEEDTDGRHEYRYCGRNPETLMDRVCLTNHWTWETKPSDLSVTIY